MSRRKIKSRNGLIHYALFNTLAHVTHLLCGMPAWLKNGEITIVNDPITAVTCIACLGRINKVDDIIKEKK